MLTVLYQAKAQCDLDISNQVMYDFYGAGQLEDVEVMTMGKKSECIRVPILLRMDNPRHQLVYNILENVDNKSAYIREAVIYYYRHNGISMKSDDILDDIRNVIQECKGGTFNRTGKRLKVID